ncbi:efflux transporter outer membrane subunit [Methylophilus sp. VKM B-3414]|uniref:efflux transporter outer membrane subunit n=1 Tax=Methylophilus sp. VKM B-3414 TaxID=3076121 RepID=UPI0028C869E1|nr:efflux transporter outer membrane subunit [Methylophilus sp. VKM B-3414]MDT7848498.1 efflux transporter outer membrane subunit [Methylophilus sp. VKM B-3414]
MKQPVLKVAVNLRRLPLWLAVVCLPLASCSVMDEYIRPKPKVATEWQAPLPHGGNLASLNNWWGQFNDPVLNHLLTEAQKESPSLEIALANIRVSRANVLSARAQGIPDLTSTGSATKSKGGGGGAFPASTIEVDSISLDASWEVDLFGKVKAAKQAAKAQLESKKIAWHDARLSLAAEVANNYVNYRACQASVDALQQAYDSRKETARLTGISAKAGFSAPSDLALAEAATRASESTLDGQQAECDGLVKAMVALTNLPEPELRQWLAKGKSLPEPAMFDVQALPASLLTRRPDLAIDERNLAEASANIGVSKAQMYPSLTLTGSIGYRRTNFNGTVTRTDSWSYGPSLKLPIFDGGTLRADLAEARANYDSLLATYQQDVRNAVKEVEQALVNLESATRRATSEQASAQQYQQYFKAAEINWKSGGLDLLSLEDARRQKINAELNVITQQKNRVLQWIALYKAFGGDWLETQATVKPIILKPMEKR